MAIPFCAVLRERFPAAGITLLCKPYVADVFRADGAIDRVTEYAGASVRARGRTARSDRPRGGYDACFVLPPSFAAAVVALFSRARRRIGFGGELRSVLLTDALPAEGYRAEHLSRAYLRLLERFTGRTEDAVPLPAVVPAASWRSAAAERAGTRDYFVLAPGATYGSSKVWPHERYAAVARRLAADRRWTPVVVGNANERMSAAALIEGASANGRNLAGDLALKDLIAVLRGARVVIGNDSGPVHVAAALGVPTVAIFGPTSPGWTAPRGSAVRIVAASTECAPCFARECSSGKLECMTRVGVDDVYRAAASLIEEGSS